MRLKKTIDCTIAEFQLPWTNVANIRYCKFNSTINLCFSNLPHENCYCVSNNLCSKIDFNGDRFAQVSLRGASAKEITRDALLERVSQERELRQYARRASSAAVFIQVFAFSFLKSEKIPNFCIGLLNFGQIKQILMWERSKTAKKQVDFRFCTGRHKGVYFYFYFYVFRECGGATG